MSAISAQNNIYESLGLTAEPQANTAKNDPSSMGLETFLKLMITQLNNQDPFKPMENGEFLSQIAQFGSVSGLEELNNSFSSLAATMTSGQALQAGSLVGREVLVSTDTARLNAGGSVSGQVDLDRRSTSTTLKVYDQVGQLVREMSLGPQEAGELRFQWDGMKSSGDYANPGLYRFEVESVLNGEGTKQNTEIFAQVDSVSLGGAEGLTLNLAGLGPVSFNSVKQIN